MKIVDINAGEDGTCTACGREAELRPYGKDGAAVCFECAMKDEAETERQLGKLIEGADVILIGRVLIGREEKQ
jgi:hypothetical protein